LRAEAWEAALNRMRALRAIIFFIFVVLNGFIGSESVAGGMLTHVMLVELIANIGPLSVCALTF